MTGTEYRQQLDALIAKRDADQKVITDQETADANAIRAQYDPRIASETDPGRQQALINERDAKINVIAANASQKRAEVQAQFDAARKILEDQARRDMAHLVKAIVTDPSLRSEAERLRQELPSTDPVIVDVHSHTELQNLLKRDAFWDLVDFVLHADDGAIFLGGERLTLTQIAGQVGQAAKLRVQEIVRFFGPAIKNAPSDAMAFKTLLHSNAMTVNWKVEQEQPRDPRLTEECRPPGAWAGIAGKMALAPLLGHLAHQKIQEDFRRQTGLVPGGPNLYEDNPLAGPIDIRFAGWLIRNNPSLRSWAQAALAATPLTRPDITRHTPLLTDFEEIKSGSGIGMANGMAKVTTITALYLRLGLPYRPGVVYVPTPRLFVAKGAVPGLGPWEVNLQARRHTPGLIVYEFCVKADWRRIALFGIALAILGIIATILSRGSGRLPFGPPLPV